jgi:hypothetical protein
MHLFTYLSKTIIFLKSGLFFRDIVCNEWKTEACGGDLVPFKDFVKHLEEKHQAVAFKKDNGTFSLKTPAKCKDLFGWFFFYSLCFVVMVILYFSIIIFLNRFEGSMDDQFER